MYNHIILLVVMVNIRNILIPSIYCFMSFVIPNTFFIIYIYIFICASRRNSCWAERNRGETLQCFKENVLYPFPLHGSIYIRLFNDKDIIQKRPHNVKRA